MRRLRHDCLPARMHHQAPRNTDTPNKLWDPEAVVRHSRSPRLDSAFEHGYLIEKCRNLWEISDGRAQRRSMMVGLGVHEEFRLAQDLRYKHRGTCRSTDTALRILRSMRSRDRIGHLRNPRSALCISICRLFADWSVVGSWRRSMTVCNALLSPGATCSFSRSIVVDMYLSCCKKTITSPRNMLHRTRFPSIESCESSRR